MENNHTGNKSKGDRFIGYLVTALVAFIVGFFLAFTFRIITFDNGELHQNPSITATPTPGGEALKTVVPTDVIKTSEPVSTFVPTQIIPDGKLPKITNQTNPIPEIVEQLVPGIVSIANYGYVEEYKKEMQQGSGTGFVISTDGYILTNSHIVEDASSVTVFLSDDEEIDAELIGMDKTSDIALIKIDSKYTGTALALGNSDNTLIGEFVIAIGDPTGIELAGTPTFGIVSAVNREVNIDGRTNKYIQTDAAINPGNSGGPLLNMKGEVIGITSAKTVTASYDEHGNAISAEGLGFAIPINDAMKIVDQLMQNGGIQRPGIGVSVSSITEVQSEYYNMPMGALIVELTKGGKGEEAGLKIGDIVVECDGEKITNQDEFVEVVRKKSVGDDLLVKVFRNGETLEIKVTVGDLNKMSSETVEEDYSSLFE